MSDLFWVCEVVYDGYEPKFDRKLEALIGRCNASGYGLNQRDISWYFDTRAKARQAKEIIKHITKSKVYKVD